MLIKREALKATIPATTTSDTRYFTHSVQVEPSGRVVATDGHILIVADDPDPQPDAEFPVVAGAPFHASPAKPFLLHVDIAKRLIAAMPKKATIPILQTVQASTNGSAQTVTVAATDLQAPMTATIHLDDQGQFPQYERILQRADEQTYVKVCMDVEVLETLIKAIKGINGKYVTFEVPNGKPECLEALRFAVKSPADTVQVSGLAMPCRI